MRKFVFLLLFGMPILEGEAQVFNDSIWCNDTLGSNGERVKMLDNLPKLTGMIEDSLYSLLGLPDFYRLNTRDSAETFGSLDLLCSEGKLLFYLYENYLYNQTICGYEPNRSYLYNNYLSSALVICIKNDRVQFVRYIKR